MRYLNYIEMFIFILFWHLYYWTKRIVFLKFWNLELSYFVLKKGIKAIKMAIIKSSTEKITTTVVGTNQHWLLIMSIFINIIKFVPLTRFLKKILNYVLLINFYLICLNNLLTKIQILCNQGFIQWFWFEVTLKGKNCLYRSFV